MFLQKHIDGEWFTSESEYNGFKLQIKMRKDNGSKIHIYKDGKVIKTFRYHFATEQKLIDKAKQWISQLIK